MNGFEKVAAMRKPKFLKRLQDKRAQRYLAKLAREGYQVNCVVEKLNDKGFKNQAGNEFTRTDVLSPWWTAQFPPTEQPPGLQMNKSQNGFTDGDGFRKAVLKSVGSDLWFLLCLALVGGGLHWLLLCLISGI